MLAPPPRANLAGTPSNAIAKTALGQLWDYVYERLGGAEGNLSYGGTLTGGTGVVNIGAGQIYKDANGNFGVGTNSPQAKAVISNGGAAGLEIFANYPGGGMGTYLQSYNRSSLGLVDTAYDALSHSFRSGSVEVIFIASNGNVQMGERSGSAQVNITASSAKNPLDLENFDDLGRGVALKNSSGVNVGAITWTATGANYATSSDYRLKFDVLPMTGALALVRQQRPVIYKWKADNSAGRGYIAHWLQEDGAGDCVTGEKDGLREEEYQVGTRKVTKLRQVTDIQIEEIDEIVLIDGKRVLRKVEHEVSVPLFEDVQVFNEDGSVATITIPALLGADGQVLTPETTLPRTVQVPVMQEYEEDEPVMGTRQVPAYQGVDNSFMVPNLNAALNELADMVDAQAELITTLTARITALEAAQ